MVRDPTRKVLFPTKWTLKFLSHCLRLQNMYLSMQMNLITETAREIRMKTQAIHVKKQRKRAAAVRGRQHLAKNIEGRGILVAQLVKCPSLDFSLGEGLRVMRWSPMLGSELSGEAAGDFLSLPISLCLPLLTLSLCLSHK